MIDQRTTNFALPLPHKDNPLGLDVERIKTALADLDALLLSQSQSMQSIDLSKQPLNALLTALSQATMGALSNRNVIINGDFKVNQRAVTAVAANVTTFINDRWLMTSGTALTLSSALDDANGGAYLNVVGATTVLGSTLRQRIEARNCGHLSGKKCTVSLVVSNTSATSNCEISLWGPSALDNFASTTVIATKTITIPTTATKRSVTFDIPASAAKYGMELRITFGGPGTFTFREVQLEMGETATPFEFRSYGAELALCMRYYEVLSGTTTTATHSYFTHRYRVQKRATPTLTFLFGTGGGANMSTGIAPTESFRMPENTVATSNADWGIAADAELR